MRAGRSSTKKRKRSGGADLLGALPEDLLNHVLSFLPSRETVQASLLSRRWCHLWRSTPAVRVSGEGHDFFRIFPNTLLSCRDAASPPLRLFHIEADLTIPLGYAYHRTRHCGWNDHVDLDVDRWVSHALSSWRARSLTVQFKDVRNVWLPRSPFTFASTHLTRIHLDAVYLVGDLLDFSCCPALLRLTLVGCHLEGDALESSSLERLAIIRCHTEVGRYPQEHDERIHIEISTPRLRFLEISDSYNQEQFLEMMPWLMKENVRYTYHAEVPS